jgi:hypothetical protein
VALLFGGYVASVEASRRRGARGILFRLRAMTAWIVRLFLNTEIACHPFPVQLRMRLEILGPTYVKLGQILSLRQDILPDVVTAELRNLLSDLPPVSYEEIHSIVEADLGRPVEDIFAEVDPVPLGSASIAQSHWARLLPRRHPAADHRAVPPADHSALSTAPGHRRVLRIHPARGRNDPRGGERRDLQRQLLGHARRGLSEDLPRVLGEQRAVHGVPARKTARRRNGHLDADR